MTRPVRVSANGVLADENRVLLNHLRHERTGDFYNVPGGGVRLGETLFEATVREVGEETGYSVTVDELLWINEDLGASEGVASLFPSGFHGLNFFFRCSAVGPALAEAHEADEFQIGVEWVDARTLSTIQLFPPVLVPYLEAFLADRTVLGPTYLGVG